LTAFTAYVLRCLPLPLPRSTVLYYVQLRFVCRCPLRSTTHVFDCCSAEFRSGSTLPVYCSYVTTVTVCHRHRYVICYTVTDCCLPIKILRLFVPYRIFTITFTCRYLPFVSCVRCTVTTLRFYLPYVLPHPAVVYRGVHHQFNLILKGKKKKERRKKGKKGKKGKERKERKERKTYLLCWTYLRPHATFVAVMSRRRFLCGRSLVLLTRVFFSCLYQR